MPEACTQTTTYIAMKKTRIFVFTLLLCVLMAITAFEQNTPVGAKLAG